MPDGLARRRDDRRVGASVVVASGGGDRRLPGRDLWARARVDEQTAREDTDGDHDGPCAKDECERPHDVRLH